MEMPVNPQAMKSGISFRLSFLTGFSQISIIQRRAVVTSTLTTFRPKGFSRPGVTNFTTLKLIPKIRLAASTAICAFNLVPKDGLKNEL